MSRKNMITDIQTTDEDTTCPICGRHKFSTPNSFEICPICDWMDDAVQANNPDWDGCANRSSLNQARAEWKAKQEKTA